MSPSKPFDRHFERRRKSTIAGVHLPSVEELLRGMAFHSNSVMDDAAEYASRLSGFIRRKSLPGYEPLLAALDDLALSPARTQIEHLDKELEALSDDPIMPVAEGRRRCGIYLATFGDIDAALFMAKDIAPLALRDLQAGVGSELLWRAVGWLLHAHELENWQDIRGPFSFPFKHHLGEVERYAHDLRQAFEKASEAANKPESAKTFEPQPIPVDRAVRRGGSESASSHSVIVFPELDKAPDRDGGDSLKEYRGLAGVPLPLPALPDLIQVRSRLISEFPYAEAVIGTMLDGLEGLENTWFPPTIFYGPPGCGKSHFAIRLAKELGLRNELFQCGGVSDGMFGGSARNWSTSQPSLPVRAVRSHRSAGPVMILDEVEKAGTGRHNGNFHDVLHGLIERETSRCWQDPFLLAHCDLSHLSWLMTANTIEPIPKSLRDRCRCILFPSPGPEHLVALSENLLVARYVEKGLDPRWAQPLDGVEIEALSSVWQGGSVRILQRLVEKLFDVREATMPRC